MKKIIITMLSLMIGFAAQAEQPVVKEIVGKLVKVELTADTQVVRLDFQSEFAVNCPGALVLEVDPYSLGETIELKRPSQGTDAILDLMRRVSPSCANEIFDDLKRPIFTCLSIGIEQGSILIDVRHHHKKELQVQLPINVVVTDTTLF